jgi:hypothetical protein
MPHFGIMHVGKLERAISSHGAVAFRVGVSGGYAMASGAPERRMLRVFRHSWIYFGGTAIATVVLLLYFYLRAW